MSESNFPGRENQANFAGERLHYLQQALDPLTFRRFEQLGVKPGWRVLEVGAGEGSVARWLARKVGSHGTVVATDIEPRLMGREHEPNLKILRHDILVDDLEQGYYDLVHTRAVLMHLSDPVGSKREEWSDFRATSEQSARRVSSLAIDCLRSPSPACFFHQRFVNWHVKGRTKRNHPGKPRQDPGNNYVQYCLQKRS